MYIYKYIYTYIYAQVEEGRKGLGFRSLCEGFKEGSLVLNKSSLRLLGLFVKRQRDGEREGLNPKP